MFTATVTITGATREFDSRELRDEWARIQSMVWNSPVIRGVN